MILLNTIFNIIINTNSENNRINKPLLLESKFKEYISNIFPPITTHIDDNAIDTVNTDIY
ncbi:hypothetical protein I3900191A7_15790 [Clostridium baratii]